jgi:hypothetical protein
MKAADAETIGGLPASAFVRATPPNANPTAAISGSVVLGSVALPTSSNVTTTGGTANTIPLFTTATNIQNSILTQSGTTVKAGGSLSATGAVTGKTFNIGNNVFAFGSYANGNAFLGFAGNSTTIRVSTTPPAATRRSITTPRE